MIAIFSIPFSTGLDSFKTPYELVKPGILPGNPLYGLDIFLEKLQLWVAQDEETKLMLHLSYAEERLSESFELLKENKTEFLDVSMNKFFDEIRYVAKDVETLNLQNRIKLGTVENVYKETEKYSFLCLSMARTYKNESKTFEKCFNVSYNLHMSSLELLRNLALDRAIQLTIRNLVKLFDEAKKCSDLGDDFSAVIFDRYLQEMFFLQESISRSRALGTDVLPIEKVVYPILYNHSHVLRKVYYKLINYGKVDNSLASVRKAIVVVDNMKNEMKKDIRQSWEKEHGGKICIVDKDCLGVVCPNVPEMESPKCVNNVCSCV